MLEKKIVYMKRKLNRMIVTKGISSPQLLRQSQKIDHLIVKLMQRKAENPHLNRTASRAHNFIGESIKGKGTTGLQQVSILYSGFNIFSC